MKIGLKQFFHPTPDKIRLFGKSFRVAAVTAAGITALSGTSPTISIILVAAAFIGEFLTNFVGDDNTKTEVINDSNKTIVADVTTQDDGTKKLVQ